MDKITLVTGIYPPDIGGPASHFQELVHSLNINRINYKLITLSDLSKSKDKNILNINRKIKNPARFFIVVYKIIKSTADSSCIYSGGLYLESFIASLLTGKKLIFRVVGDPVWERARNKNRTSIGIDEFQERKAPLSMRIERKLFSYIFKRAKYIVTPSDYLKTIIENWGVTPNRIKIIVNAVNINNEGTQSIKKRYDVITVCRLVSWKGIEELIEISKKNNLKLAIVGDGPNDKMLRSLAKSHEENITFHGNLSKENTIRCLLESKIFFLNSSYEGLPHTLLEAMSLGIPCIATETGGSKAVITNYFDGVLVPLQGLEIKTEVTMRLLKDLDLQKKISSNAKYTMNTKYSLHAMIENLMNLFFYK